VIEKLVVWGGHKDLSSHRHIHRHYHETARKMGIQSVWVNDIEARNDLLGPGVTCIAIDIDSEYLDYVEGTRYVLHNFDASHVVCQHAPPEDILRMQVWTDAATGEKWDECRSFDKDGRIVFFPWGTNLLAEEFMEPVFNTTSNEAVFVGAIWSERSSMGELGNEMVISELRNRLEGLGFKFVHYTHISDEDNVRLIRQARLAPAIAGGWQVGHGYLPCRCFKNASYGQLMFTNVHAVNKLFSGATVAGNGTKELLENVLKLRQKDFSELVREQQKIAARYTYRQNLENIDRAFQELR